MWSWGEGREEMVVEVLGKRMFLLVVERKLWGLFFYYIYVRTYVYNLFSLYISCLVYV